MDSVPPMVMEMVKKQMSSMRAVSEMFVRRFAEEGVPMLVGQDGCDPTGTSLEMKALHALGVSPAEILRGATIHPARWLGVEGRLGSIEDGKEADILIVGANPLEDIGAIDSVFAVIVNGKRMK